MAGPRQIVPLVRPQELAAPRVGAPTAHLTDHGGPKLAAVEVHTVFWGDTWEQAAGIALAGQVNVFFQYILTSPLMDVLAQYGCGPGRLAGTNTITNPAPASSVSDGDIQTQLQAWVNDGTLPAPAPNSLYFLYLPPDVTVTMGGGASCSEFCGYHNHVGSIVYAVEPYITCDGCTSGEILDSLTKVSSHELCEAMTDPALNGWFDDAGGDEIGDICNTDIRSMGGFTIQAEWSNAVNACVVQSVFDPQQQVDGVGTSFRPSLGVFGDRLFMAWKGVDDDQGIYWTSFDGGGWAPQQNVGGVGTSVGPAIAWFGDRLFMAWKGVDDDQGIYWSSFDGGGWADQQNVPGVGTSVGPELAVFRNRLYMAWKGVDGDQGIWFGSFDGSRWTGQENVGGVGTSVGPSLAAFRDRMYMAWKGVDGDDGIYWTAM